MANTKLPARLLDTSAVPTLNVTGDLTVDTNTLKVDSTNNSIGIGTASPVGALTINGNDPLITFENGEAPHWQLGFENTQSDRFVLYDNNASAYRVVVNSAGEVGIGTTAPNTFDSRARNLVVRDTGDVGISIVSGNTSDARIAFTIAGDTGLSNGAIHYDNSNDKFHFSTGGTDRLYIDNAGNVGFGVLVPTHPLDIASNTSAQGIKLRGRSDHIGELNFSSHDGSTIYSQIQSLATELKVKAITNIPLSFHQNNSRELSINTSAAQGKISIGDHSATANNSQVAIHGGGNNAGLVISNTDLSTSATSYGWAGRGGRYLTSNGTNWDVDGRDPALVIGQNTATDNRGQGIGIILHNDSNTNTHYGPIVGWGTKSTSNSYNSMYAYIVGKKTGTGVDNNWSAGELQFDTAGLKPNGSNQYMTDTPAMTITESGAVIKPHQPHIRLSGNSASRVTNQGSTVTAFTNFSINSQRGITFNSGNGLITLPIAGTYLIQYSFYLWMNNIGHGVSHSVNLFRNSTMQQESIMEQPDHTPGGSYIFDNTLSNSLILDCATGDTLRWQTYADIYGGSVHTNASIYLLG